jgi:hypothetical protein
VPSAETPTSVAAGPEGAFTLPNGQFVARDGIGGVILPNRSRRIAEGAQSYLCIAQRAPPRMGCTAEGLLNPPLARLAPSFRRMKHAPDHGPGQADKNHSGDEGSHQHLPLRKAKPS